MFGAFGIFSMIVVIFLMILVSCIKIVPQAQAYGSYVSAHAVSLPRRRQGDRMGLGDPRMADRRHPGSECMRTCSGFPADHPGRRTVFDFHGDRRLTIIA